jgi:chemotaxis protein methyltransferase CheR
VAESRPEIRDLVVRILDGTDGLSVRGCVGELNETLAAIEAFGPEALVFGSCGAAGSETEALRGIRQARPELPVVLFSPLFTPGTPAVRAALALGGCTRLPCRAARYAPSTLPQLVQGSLAPWIRKVVLKPDGPQATPKNFLHLEVPSEEDVRFVRDLIRQRTAIALDTGREFLVHVRLAPLARNRGFLSISQLVSELRANQFGGLHKDVIDAMLASQSSFFREAALFLALRQEILPDLIRRRAEDRSLNLWSVACSTGQEPYSLAMLMEEFFPVLREWDVNLVASDSSARALEKARKGRYDDIEVSRGVPIQMLGHNFMRQGDGWLIRRSVRDRIDFQQVSLIDPWPSLPPFDLVILRDVLIYLEERARNSILEKLAAQMRPGGVVILGPSDSPLPANAWESVGIEGVPVYRTRET